MKNPTKYIPELVPAVRCAECLGIIAVNLDGQMCSCPCTTSVRDKPSKALSPRLPALGQRELWEYPEKPMVE